MIPGPVALPLAILAGLLACLLAIAGGLLSALSRGAVRKLESRDAALAEQLESLLRNDARTLLVLRLLLLLDVGFLAYLFAGWMTRCAERGSSLPLRYLPLAAGLLGYYLLTEFAVRHLNGRGAARFVIWMGRLIEVLGIPLLPITFPIWRAHQRLDQWREAHSQEEEKTTAEDEILSLVESDHEENEDNSDLEEDERRMIRGIFDLDETLVHEIMTPRVDLHAVPDTATLQEVRDTIIETGHSRIPVYRESVDHIVGVVYAKDLLDGSRVLNDGDLAPLYHRPVFIPETKNVGDLLAEFQQTRNHLAVVLDEYGGTAGIVTFEDVLEEIVGEIRDEYDTDELPNDWTECDGGAIEADGRTPIYELLSHFEIRLPEDHDCDTLGGYISSAAGRIPQRGETVEDAFFRFHILDADPRKVLKARVARRDDQEDADES